MLQSLEQPSASAHAAILFLICGRRELGPSSRVGWICYGFLYIWMLECSQKNVNLVEGKSSCSQTLEMPYQLFLVC